MNNVDVLNEFIKTPIADIFENRPDFRIFSEYL